MARHGRITVEVEIERGVYWPQVIADRVTHDESDPVKDDWSHLAALVVEALSSVHGVRVQAIMLEQALL